MSRYGVNKALWIVGRDDAQAAIYMEAPEAFLADFSLTPEENRQLMERDYAGMFADGAHPFLLYTYRIKLAGGFSFPLLMEHVKSLSGSNRRSTFPLNRFRKFHRLGPVLSARQCPPR